MNNIGRKFLAGVCLSSLLINRSSAMNYRGDTNLVNGAGATSNKVNKNASKIYCYGLVGLGIVGVAAATTATIAALCANNLSEKQKIMNFLQKLPSVYDCDEQTLSDIQGTDKNDSNGKSKRYYDKVLCISNKIKLGAEISSEQKKKLNGYSIPVLLVLASDALRTYKLIENSIRNFNIENKSSNVFGFVTFNSRPDKSGKVYHNLTYKISGRHTIWFKFWVNEKDEINCVVIEAIGIESKEMVQLIFNNQGLCTKIV